MQKTSINLIILLIFSIQSIAQNGLIEYPLPPNLNTYGSLYAKKAICSEEDGTLWITSASVGKGISKLKYGHYSRFVSDSFGFYHGRIHDMVVYNSTIYLATDSGLIATDTVNWINMNTANGIPVKKSYSVYADNESIVTARANQLNIFTDNGCAIYDIPPGETGFYSTKNLCKDENGTIWCSNGRRLIGFTGDSWINYYFDGSISSLVCSGDKLWIGLRNKYLGDNDSNLGSYIYCLRNGELTNLANQYGDALYFVKDVSVINSMSCDDFGNLYFAYSGGGIGIISGNKVSLFPMILPYNTNYFPILHVDSNNKLWIAVYGMTPGIYSFAPDQYSDFGLAYTNRNYKSLDINNVKAWYLNRGSFFWDGYNSGYEVPKGSGKHSSYITATWFGAKDDKSNLHVAGSKWFPYDGNLSPGPLDTTNASTDTSIAKLYDRIWKIDRFDIEYFKYMFNNEMLLDPSYEIPRDILEWPAHGQGNISRNLAPFIDVDNDGIYNPYKGDYPEIKGDQMLWWVYNDNLSYHSGTKGIPLGIEVHASAYAFLYDDAPDQDSDLINYQTFANFKVFNRSDTTYYDSYFGIGTENDLGYYCDDYVGCDVKNSTFYFYNADSIDGDGTGLSYGEHPPIMTFTILEGPYADFGDGVDNDRDSIIDEKDEQVMLSKFMNCQCGGIIRCPFTAEEYYDRLSGYVSHNLKLTYGGNGYNSQSVDSCDFMYPGTSDPYGWGTNGIPKEEWSEETENSQPYDRRGIGSMGPFTFAPGDMKEFTVLFGFYRDTLAPGPGRYDMFRDDLELITDWFHKDSIPSNYSALDNIPKKYIRRSKKFSLYPNPATNELSLLYKPETTGSFYDIYNLNGTECITGNILSEGRTIIKTSNLHSGLYFLKIFDGDIFHIEKFVIQK